MSKNKKSLRQKNVSVYSITGQTTTSGPDKNTIKNIRAFFKISSRWWVIGLIVLLSLGVLGAGLKYLEDSAREEKARRQKDPLGARNESLLAQVNPFMPTPTPTPQFSKEYIYAGSRLVAVEDIGASAIPPGDLAVWRPSNGTWYIFGGLGSQQFATSWGTNGDVPVQGDYDGDGKTDLAIYRPPAGSGTGVWWIVQSSNGQYYTVSLGAVGDQLAAADYDGDGRTDPAVLHSGTTWQIAQSSTQTVVSEQFGQSADKPAVADYDGDGKDDIATWRDSSATFYVLKSSDRQWQSQALNQAGDSPVPADYDGDGKADYAVRHGDDWIIKQSSNGQTQTITWQSAINIAVPNDYDGDGKVDIAVWRNKNGNWYIRNSSTGQLRQEAWGTTGDIPVPAYYRR